MFKKLISNLPFSPALIGQLSFYAKRLRKEQATRKLGLIFTMLALVVQSFAVFQAPESANAASGSDLINGGVTNMSQLLKAYDSNKGNIKDFYKSTGITRAEIAKAKSGTINSKKVNYSWGRTKHFSASQGEKAYTFQTDKNKDKTFFARPLKAWDSTSYTKKHGSTYQAFIGHSKKIGSFAIIKDCANLVTKYVPPPPPPPKCPTGELGTPPNCKKPPKPAAVCSGLSVTTISRTSYKLSAHASVSGGAHITGYIYTIKDKDNKTVHSKKISSSKSSDAQTFTVEKRGNYKASVTVLSTAGSKTSSDCAKPLVVAPPEVCPLNADLSIEDTDCKPCPGDSSIWYKDEGCKAQVVQSKSATNVTQSDKDATKVVANGSDKIRYTVTLENTGKLKTELPIDEHLDDVLEYASLVDNGGGSFDKETQVLHWEPIEVKPGETQTRMFTVQVNKTVPAMAQGTSDKTSYDCIMSNTFGNNVSVSVNCPTPKIVERTVAELPHTGPRENMLFAGVTLAIVAYFYFRSRQVNTEIRLVRRSLNSGTI
ncbi:MAG: hypothetical protein L0H36_02795 [bacterium]|nr:hypothetical protein [bacterium]MDN5835537.1 hypothetical protein [bacterium]